MQGPREGVQCTEIDKKNFMSFSAEMSERFLDMQGMLTGLFVSLVLKPHELNAVWI